MIAATLVAPPAYAQDQMQTPAPSQTTGQTPSQTQPSGPAIQITGPQATPAAGGPTVITFEEAVRRAQSNDTAYITAVANRALAAQDRTIARSALLPSVIYHNQFLYTQPQNLSAAQLAIFRASGQIPTPIFIANNAVHEYISQAQVNETLGLNLFAQYKRSNAAAALATAQQEIARRDLVLSVVNGYFSMLAAAGKLTVAQRAADEAGRFSGTTRRLEAGGEVAYADVVKADLQQQQRQRDLSDAKLLADRTRLDLGVLLFPDPRTEYTLADALISDPAQLPAVPAKADVETAARNNNPDLRAALEAVRVADQDVSAARFAYLPTLTLNYSYGIDAVQFAVNNREGVRNLGYSAFANLDIPVWDWLATQSRVRQSNIRRDVARTELSTSQRRLLADLEELYNEAQSAGNQLQSLDASVAGAQQSLKLVNLRYSAGEATVLEVVDAQNTLTGTEILRADGIVRYRAALANLQTLTGKLP